MDYNHYCPHSLLGVFSPVEFDESCIGLGYTEIRCTLLFRRWGNWAPPFLTFKENRKDFGDRDEKSNDIKSVFVMYSIC